MQLESKVGPSPQIGREDITTDRMNLMGRAEIPGDHRKMGKRVPEGLQLTEWISFGIADLCLDQMGTPRTDPEGSVAGGDQPDRDISFRSHQSIENRSLGRCHCGARFFVPRQRPWQALGQACCRGYCEHPGAITGGRSRSPGDRIGPRFIPRFRGEVLEVRSSLIE